MMIYVMGSLRNPRVLEVTIALDKLGFEVFSEWFGTGPDADQFWQDYEKARGRTYLQALKGWAARNIFEFDKFHLDRCDAGVLVYDAGKSAHTELGYLIGKGKPAYILLNGEPERYDVMANFATDVFPDLKGLTNELENLRGGTLDSQGSSEGGGWADFRGWPHDHEGVVGARERGRG